MHPLYLAHEESAGSLLPNTVLLVAVAAAVGAAYWAGVGRLHPGTGSGPGRSWSWRRWCFLAGLAVLVVTLLPVLDPYVDASFALHMSQHLVLLFVAAPLLALGAPGLPLLLALPRRSRRRVARIRGARPMRLARTLAGMPGVMLPVSAVLMLAWHLPSLYTAALRNDTVHVAEHLCFLLSGALLWMPLTTPGRALDGMPAVLYVFVGGFPSALVATVLTFAPRPLYPAQTGTGPGAMSAQALAGSLMWLPSTFLAVVLCAVLILVWLRRMEQIAPGGAPLPSPIPPPLPVPAARTGQSLRAGRGVPR